MSNGQEGQETSAEVVFDVMNASGPMEFLGLLKGLDGGTRELAGLFRWRCPSCAATRQDMAIIRPEQVFLARWMCAGCSKVMVVQFRARPAAEWITAHSVAITGKAFGHLAEDEGGARGPAGYDCRPQRRPQTLFAWIAVPALIGLIALGLNDWRRIDRAAASAAPDRSTQPALGPFTQLAGYWVSDDRSHTIYFRHADPDSRDGMYMKTTSTGQFLRNVSFRIIQEEDEGERLVLQEVRHDVDGAVGPADAEGLDLGATLYVPKSGGSIMRVETIDGRPVTTAYHRVNHASRP